MAVFCQFCGQSPPVPAQCAHSGDGKHHFQEGGAATAEQAPKEVVINPQHVYETAVALRKACGEREHGHTWQVVGCSLPTMPKTSETTMPVCLIVRACFDCSSYTYHPMQFIGDRDDVLED